MKRIVSVVTATAMIALAGVAASAPAQARDEGAIIGGAIGGLALGAMLGAAAQPRPQYGYDAEPVYVAPRRPMCVERREIWSNRYQGYVVRNIRVPC
jgi:hypothetical protein